MSLPYHHGARVVEINEGARPVRRVATGVLGLVASAADADVAAFPVGKPVLVTDLDAAIAKAGEAPGGTLAPALEAIRDQTSPIVVVVRAADGADAAADSVNAVAAVNALSQAESLLGVRPRILGAPGLDTPTVTAALAGQAAKLRGFAYASCDVADTLSEAIAYREGYSARELMLIYPDFTRGTGVSAQAIARAMGLRARIDEEQGFNRSLSNVGVAGVTGISAPVFFDLQDASSEANQLNMNDVTTLVRMNGFRFWGSRTCSDDPLFAFEPTVRTGQVIADTVAAACAWAVDKPVHPTLARDIVEMINAELRSLKQGGFILGGEAWLDTAVNTAGEIKSGRLTIDYDYTPTPPAEDITLNQRITDRHIATAFGLR